MKCRPATSDDAGAIAALHADSWQRNYRGAFLDEYLDGDAPDDRLAVWTDRLVRPAPDACTIVAEDDGEFVGFAHVVLDDDPRWGALLDNLHVTHERKRLGTGTQLMSEAARAVLARTPGSGMYLWVLEQNTRAQAFYAARGGTEVERTLRGPFPGGGSARSLRIFWPDPRVLLEPG